MAFDRMVRSYCKPTGVISDNGTNLAAGQRVLSELVLDRQRIEEKYDATE